MALAGVRPYRPTDHQAVRRLWTELTEQHRPLHPAARGGVDPGVGFEEYLTRLDLSGVWVAEHPDHGVVGLVGLIMDGPTGRVEPVVVNARLRGRGIGRALLEHVAREAGRRGLRRLTITPDSRNIDALRCLHSAGYDVLSAVQLSLDLGDRPVVDGDDIELYGLRFRS